MDCIIDALATCQAVDHTVLGIADTPENLAFELYAAAKELPFIRGDEEDGLARLIACAEMFDGTDVFRTTTENPFVYTEIVDAAWQEHVSNDNDLTLVDDVPDGCNFGIYKISALKISHSQGEPTDRSAYIERFILRHRDQFKISALPIPPQHNRLDLRLTVDLPEDLIVCRAVYNALKSGGFPISLTDIIEFLDARPDLLALVADMGPRRSVWKN